MLKYICLFLLMLCTGCSTVTISNLHTQAGAGANTTDITKLKRFDLFPADENKPFSEMLALDTVKDNLVARGYILDSQNPDFLVLVYNKRDFKAESHRVIVSPMPSGWYYPGFANNRHWPGYQHSMLAGGYTSIKNYAAIAILFLKPTAPKIKQEQTAWHDLQSNEAGLIPPSEILWYGEAYSESNRNAFTVLSCLAAGILSNFPHSETDTHKTIELKHCH